MKLENILKFTLVAGTTFLLYRIQKEKELNQHYQNIMRGVYQEVTENL